MRPASGEELCEEFVLLLQETEASGADTIAVRMRGAIADSAFVCSGESFQVTATFGVSSYEDPFVTIEDCVQVADTVLYVGKDQGRNQVVVLHMGPQRP
jgi:diguanylate cyclase (GGDEF)-like protein